MTLLLLLLGCGLRASHPGSGRTVIDPGTTVRITDVGPRDAFARFERELRGQVCIVDEPGLVPQAREWYSGPLTCEDELPLYFFQVGVEVGDFTRAVPSLVGSRTTPEPPEGFDAPARPPVDVVPEGPPPEWPIGARVRIRDLSSADDNAGRRRELLGRTCTVAEAPLAESGPGWLSGALQCEGAGNLYFFQVAVDRPSGDAPKVPTPLPSTARLRTPEIPAGRLVKVVDVSASDLHHDDRAALVGKTCSVAEGPLVATGEGWYAGRLFCGPGSEWQLYQVAVTSP